MSSGVLLRWRRHQPLEKKHMRILIPNYRARSRNGTITSHWRIYQRERDNMAILIRYHATDRIMIQAANVIINAYFKANRCIDTSNIDDKFILDGLMKAGILQDDSPKFNPTVTKSSIPNSGKDELEIIIEPI